MRIRAETFKQALASAGAQQIILLLLASAILDGGVVLQVCVFGFAAFWVGVAIIYARRRLVLTKLDLLLVEAGTVPLSVISFFLSYFIWNRRGVL
jgi:hypothetical protein